MRKIAIALVLLAVGTVSAQAQAPQGPVPGPATFANTPYPATGGTTPISPANRAAQVVNLLDGASGVAGGDPTGTTDSTAALVAVCSAALSAGKNVYAPAGTYLLDGASLSGCAITGDGPGLTILKRKASASVGYVVQFSAVGGATVQNLTVDGNKSNETVNAVGLYFPNAWNVTLSNVVVTGAKGTHNIYFNVLTDAAHSTKTQLTNVWATNGDLDGIHEHGASQDFTVNGGGASGNTSGIGLVIENNGTYPVPVASILRPSITGFRSTGNLAGIALQGFCGSASVTFCVSGYDTEAIDQPTLIGNYTSSNTHYGTVVQADHARVVGNTSNSNGGTGSTYAGFLVNASDCEVGDNTATGNEYYGIDAGGSYHCTFHNNHLWSNGNSTANNGIGLNLEGTQWADAHDNDVGSNGSTGAGAQIVVRRDGATGTTNGSGGSIGFGWSGQHNSVHDNFMYSANNNQYGVLVVEDPQFTQVKNNFVSNNDSVTAFWLASTSLEARGNHTDGTFPVPVGIGLPTSTLTFPDWYEEVQINSASSGSLSVLAPQFYTAYITSVYKILVTAPGSGYTNPSVSGLCGGATAQAFVTQDGKISNIRVTAKGTGCSPGTASVTITDGTGTGAAATSYVQPITTLVGRRFKISWVASTNTNIATGGDIFTPNNVARALTKYDVATFVGIQNGTTSALWELESVASLMQSTAGGAPPTDNGCNSATATGNSKRGTVTVPAGSVTSCAMSWATPSAWGATPHCTVGNFSVSGDTGKIVPSTSGFTVTVASSIGGGAFDYSCEP